MRGLDEHVEKSIYVVVVEILNATGSSLLEKHACNLKIYRGDEESGLLLAWIVRRCEHHKNTCSA
jgi:hypothetical protein